MCVGVGVWWGRLCVWWVWGGVGCVVGVWGLCVCVWWGWWGCRMWGVHRWAHTHTEGGGMQGGVKGAGAVWGTHAGMIGAHGSVKQAQAAAQV